MIAIFQTFILSVAIRLKQDMGNTILTIDFPDILVELKSCYFSDNYLKTEQ